MIYCRRRQCVGVKRNFNCSIGCTSAKSVYKVMARWFTFKISVTFKLPTFRFNSIQFNKYFQYSLAFCLNALLRKSLQYFVFIFHSKIAHKNNEMVILSHCSHTKRNKKKRIVQFYVNICSWCFQFARAWEGKKSTNSYFLCLPNCYASSIFLTGNQQHIQHKRFVHHFQLVEVNQ